MADNNLTNDVKAETTAHTDNEPATRHDVTEGGVIGAVGGAIVGGLAAGPLAPVGAVVGAIVGGIASAAAVDVVDKHDKDYARTVAHHDTATLSAPGQDRNTDDDPDATRVIPATGMAGVDDTAGTATAYTGAGEYQRAQITPLPTDTVVDDDLAADDALIGTGAMGRVGTDTDQRVQLREERLDVEKQPVQTGEVTLHKDVITETRSIDVPVTREEVVVERHAVSGAAAAGTSLDDATDEVIRVPVMEEQVTVQKTPVVTGEVSLGKRQVTETEHVTETVRREEARVENTGDVDVLERGDAASTRSNP